MNIKKYFSDKVSDITESKLLVAIRHGVIYTIPIILLGSISVLFLNMPLIINIIKNTMLEDFFINLNTATFDIISIVTAISISYSIFMVNKKFQQSNINFIVPVLVVFSCYFMIVNSYRDYENILGTAGFFVAILVSIICSYLFLFFNEHKIYKNKSISEDGNIIINQALSVVEPTIFTISVVIILKIVFEKLYIADYFLTMHENIIGYFSKTKNLLGYTYFSVVSRQFFWFFGVHGTHFFDSINGNTLNNILDLEPIINKQFLDVFVYIGGAGSIFGLIISTLIIRKNNAKQCSKLAIIFASFNISEVMLFGFPVVFNLYLFVPFILTPVVLLSVSYIATCIGLVPLALEPISWTTPVLINAYLATGKNLKGIILQLLNIGLSALLYYPFLVKFENHIIERNKNIISKLIQKYNELSKTKVILLKRNDELGYVSRNIIKDLITSLRKGINPINLEYQPQSDVTGKVIGCEALLRWKHNKYGMISPFLIALLAEEANIMEELGQHIIKRAMKDLKVLEENNLTNIAMSINLSGTQLKNADLIGFIDEQIKINKVNPKKIGFELTETVAIELNDEVKQKLWALKNMGVELSIDDFGMGHSSLVYIKDFAIDEVKIDGVLVKDVDKNLKSQEIVSSIINLCKMLNLKVIAEMVETKQQINKLDELGCNIFQGFYFSKSLKIHDFIKYTKKHNAK